MTQETGARFAFGENWRAYLELIDESRIRAAEDSLLAVLGDLSGRSFLDIGSGSGLFSLAARRLGAHVVSFDFDASSVWCAEELRRRYRPDDDDWRIRQGSALDEEFSGALGTFDVVYSWGVLHHTGGMWAALELACQRVGPGGSVFIALYNDQGRASKYWRAVKRLYNAAPDRMRLVVLALVAARWMPKFAYGDLMSRRNPLARYRNYGASRGMGAWRDWVDWVGGYPFETARPGDVFSFLRERGFEMLVMRTDPGWGCNEYVARRSA